MDEKGVKYELFEEKLRKQVIHELNPHFLFNALTYIIGMEKRNPEIASVLSKEFGDYLRGVMTEVGSRGEWITLYEEMKVVKAYLHIQSFRFSKRVRFSLDICDEEQMVPIGAVRALVENAVSHGLRKRADGGMVIITQSIHEGRQIITVRDDGPGFDVSKLKDKTEGSVYSLRGIVNEIDDAMLSIKSDLEKGTTAELILPI